jgi:integrase
MRGFFQWALENEHVRTDPTQGIKIAKPTGDGFAAWTEQEIAAFEDRWPLGTRERLMLDLFQFTGLRRGDVARLGRQHVTNGIISITTEKTQTRVVIPVLPELAHTLANSPCGDLTFVVGERGLPMTKEGMANAFRSACRAAGIADKSGHGLRKFAAARLATAGASVAELNSVFGWEGSKQASHYTKSADRERMAKSAMERLQKKT